MEREIKRVVYESTNSYETLNKLNGNTKNIWVVFHGIGYLSKYFLKYFAHLNAEENYMIAPQAPSKYYLKDEYKYVGASWLTKVDTQHELKNVVNYLDAIAQSENLFENKNLILFGFSQSVSVLTRWMVAKKLHPKKVILYAGGIPNELSVQHFDYLDYEKTEVILVYGDSDVFLTKERLKKEEEKIKNLFNENAQIINFEGGHEIKPEIIAQLVASN